MKRHLAVQWAGVASLLAGLAWGGSVTVAPSSVSYLQTDLNVGGTQNLSIKLSGWDTTNVTTTAAIKAGSATDIFSVDATSGSLPSAVARTLYLTPLGKAGSTIVTVTVTADNPAGAASVSCDVDATVIAVPEIRFPSSTLTLNEDSASNFNFTVEYWGDASALTSWTTSVPSGSTDLVQTASIASHTGTNGAVRITPQPNKYGSRTFTLTVSDNQSPSQSDTKTLTAKVQPVADAPAIGSWPAGPIRLEVGGMPATNVLAGITVADVDHLAYVNGTSNEYLKASAAVDAAGVFFSPGNGSSSTNFSTGQNATNIATWARKLSLYPPDFEDTYMPVGQTATNKLKLVVYGYGANDFLSSTQSVSVLLSNPNHPPQYLPTTSPSSLTEGQSIFPFSISQLYDPDVIHTTFSLRLFVEPRDAALATLSSTGLMHGNQSELNTRLASIGLTGASGVMTTLSTNVTVNFVLSDSMSYVTNSVTLTVNQIRTAPVINGIDEVTSFFSINDTETLAPFPMVIPYDTDQGGQQWLRASVSVSDPNLGGLTYQGYSVTNLPLQSQSDLKAALRSLLFVPAVGALTIGSSAQVSLSLTLTDSTGLSAINSSTRVLITAVNKAPSVKVPQVQPVLLTPGDVLLPFADVAVTNDDANSVTVSIAMDDSAKGTLGNLGGFAYESGKYTMSGSLSAINASLTNITYAISSAYIFPADDPGGTVFTLEAEDYQIKLGSAQLWVQIQNAPRNHLVTKTANDGTPGSLLFVLAHAENNDVITFALPEYPAVIRVPAAIGPLVLSKALTLKGPGADLLTISGDGDGDGAADGQIFVVQSRVMIEGVTLAQGHASFGGAVSVAETGSLTLRACSLVDCEAESYGGAIDVEGTLRLEGCYLARNRVMVTGFGGGAISFYTSHDSSIVNTTFASNRLENTGGYGGGAIYVERDSAAINIAVTHSTFAGNADFSDKASAVYVEDGITYATLKNNIFSDYSAQDGARNIDVNGAAWIVSEGGNVCDDSTRTAYLQAGGTSVYLLTHATDRTAVAPGLGGLTLAKGDTEPYFPLLADSPALRRAQPSEVTTDQRGRVRRTAPRDSGAIQQDATERVVITEIQFSSDVGINERFIELYVPSDSAPVSLAGCGLYVNGELVHRFAEGLIINEASGVFTGAPTHVVPGVKGMGALIGPGNGLVVAFPVNPLSSPLVQTNNPTPVVGASVVTNHAAMTALLASAYPGRGSVSVKLLTSSDLDPVVAHTFLSTFIDPLTETNHWYITRNGIATAPQAHGFAFIPHSTVSYGLQGGMDRQLNTANLADVQSPGAWPNGTPFGLNNAFPQAVQDEPQVQEDDASALDLMANDLDADANDVLSIVNLYSTLSGASGANNLSALTDLGASIEVLADGTVLYDPRSSAVLQALPAGGQVVDTFHYELIDFGSDEVVIIPESNNYAFAYMEIHAPNHRLSTNDVIAISGAARADYNGAFAVATVVDADNFRVAMSNFTQVAEYGVWRALSPRTPSQRSSTTVSVTVAGLNDTPTGTNDVITKTFTERQRLRIMAYPDLATQQTSVVFFDDPVPAPVLAQNESLLPNDRDCDAHDAWDTLRAYGVVSPANVRAVAAVSGVAGEVGVTLESANHGLADGSRILVAGYGGAARYNGWQTVAVADANHFVLSVAYEDIPSGATWAQSLVWVSVSEEVRLSAVTPKGAVVTLARRANPKEDNVLYNASASSYLQTLAEGETTGDSFYYLVQDAAGAIGLARVDVTVTGVNNPPTTKPDPDSLDRLDDLLEGTTLSDVLTNQLYSLTVITPAESGLSGRADVIVSDKAAGAPTTESLIELPDFFFTDEDTSLIITAPELVANDVDIDTLDNLFARHRIAAVQPLSVRGAAVSVDASGTNVTYSPAGSAQLQTLAQGEQVFDLFTVYVTDGLTNVPSQVAVLVRGVNDAPSAGNFWLSLTNNVAVSFDPRGNAADVDASDRLLLLPAANVVNAGGAQVDIGATNIASGAILGAIYDSLGTGRTFTNAIPFTVTDNSLLFAADDLFRVPAGVSGRTLDVLANDIDRTMAVEFGIASVTPSLRGGTIAIADSARSLVYSAPAGYAGNDLFSYTVTNSLGISRTANVKVRVIRHAFNGPFHAANDTYVLARGTTMTLPVLDNDNILPETADSLVLEGLLGAPVPGLTQAGDAFVYAATNAAVTNVVFSYGVNGGGSVRAVATVSLRIVDRPVKIQDDFFAAQPGAAAARFDLLANDVLYGEPNSGMAILSLDTAGTVGSVFIGAGGTNVLYSAPAGFRGIDNFSYRVIDRYGATGLGEVHVAVGAIFATADFYQVATNTVTVFDVLSNDRALPDARASLTVTRLEKVATNSVGEIGALEIDAASGATVLRFTASDVVGAETYRYVIQDAGTPPRNATGLVSIVTVPTDTLNINADSFTVRASGAGVILEVLSNDVSYVQGRQSLVITSVEATGNHGGTIAKVGTRTVQYTPASGYLGEETFRYYATDAMTGVREAVVTVQVVPGDLLVNEDRYVIGYTWDGYAGMASAIELNLLENDALLPANGGTLAITSVGIGADAPSMGGTVTLAPDSQSVYLRPGANPVNFAPSNEFTEVFSYEVTDSYGRKQAARVAVRVRLRVNEMTIETSDDAYVVERNSQTNLLPVLANDLLNPLMPLQPSELHVTASAQYGRLEAASGNTAFVYTPPAGFVGVDTATYTISDGLGGSGAASITIFVGALPTADDRFVVLMGSVSNKLNLIANDAITADYRTSYYVTNVMGVTAGGAVIPAGTNAVIYTPLAGFTGTEQFLYELADDSNRRTTGMVTVVVLDPAKSRASATAYLLYSSSGAATSVRQAWNAVRFTLGQVTSGDAAGSSDPDLDGVSNDAEYVFGGDPNVLEANVGHIDIDYSADGSADVAYTRRANDPALTYHLYGAATLAGPWTEIDSLATVATQAVPSDPTLVVATHHVAAPGSYRFFKIVVVW